MKKNLDGNLALRLLTIAVIIIITGIILAIQTGFFTKTTNQSTTNNPDTQSSSTSNPDQSPTSSPLTHKKLDEALAAASQYLNTDKMGEAEKILEALQKDNPENTAVLRQLYELRLFQQNYQAAYTIIRKILDLGSTDPETYFNAGTIAFNIGKITQAAAHYQQAATLDTTNPKYPLYLAQMQVKLHEYTKAKVNLLKVINLNGSIHEAFGTLAQIALLENKLDTAQQNIDRARTIAPDFFKWRLIEAKILRRKGNPEEALARLNAITDPKFLLLTELVEEKAQCWAMLNQPVNAAKEYINQLNQYPDAWHSALQAAKYFFIAGDETKGKLWYIYAEKRAPADAREILDFKKQHPQLTDQSDNNN